MNACFVRGFAILSVAIILVAEVRAQPSPIRIRRNFSSLTPEQKESFKKGVAVMKSRPADDPTSWQFQANIHGVLGSPTSPLHRQCEHGTEYFLVWHRGYLHYFERILREASGDPSLTLPYWNWPLDSTLPVEFRLPNNADNPLFENPRTLNDGSMLNTSPLNWSLSNAMSQNNFFRFQNILEGPHGGVHVMVGGRMGGVPTSANDPIFWLHHANVDRQWDQWLAASSQHQNPNLPNFLNRSFSFADERGRTVTRTVRELLSSADLGYRYDDIPMAPEMPIAHRDPDRRILATSATIAEAPADLKLGFAEKRIALKFEDRGLESLRAVRTEGLADEDERVMVRVKGVHFKETPAYSYGVFLNLPEGENNQQRMAPYFVGMLDFFSATGQHNAGHANEAIPAGDYRGYTFDQELDLTATIATLKKDGKWNPEKVEVALIPIAPIPPKELEAAKTREFQESAGKAGVTYERIEIIAGR